MTKLEQLIEQLCPDGVEYKPLEQCCNILDNKRKPITKSSRITGEYPYYGANGIQDYVADYIFDGTFVLVGEDGSVQTEKGNPVVNWAVGKIWVNNHAHIVEESKTVLLRFIYHYLQTVNVAPLIHGNIPKLTGKDFRAISIPVPPLEVQEVLVKILDKFTDQLAELTDNLSAEQIARKKQYEYYRNNLLSYNTEVETIQLKDISDSISSGKNKSRQVSGQFPVYGSTGIIAKTDTPVYNKEQLLIARVGANAGFVHIATGEYDVSDNTLMIEVKKDYVLKYIYYLLVNKNLNQYAKGGGQPLITAGQLKGIALPIPSYDTQKRIVKVLDNFEAICSDLNIGLPTEIEARQKQYEYYRDLLLTFAETGGKLAGQTDRQAENI